MNKLQYDSFYKFLVSLGLIIIISPLLGISFFICQIDDFLITTKEITSLTCSSINLLNRRDYFISFFFEYFIHIYFILLFLGAVAFFYGLYHWKRIQRELDSQTRLTTKSKEFDVKKLENMSWQEVENKQIKEISNKRVSPSNKDNFLKTNEIKLIEKSLKTHNQCFYFIRNSLSSSYEVKQNIRIKNYEYDIIAIARESNLDYIFEIKYAERCYSDHHFLHIKERLLKSGEAYKKIMHRQCKVIIMLVCPNGKQKEFKKYFSHNDWQEDIKVVSLEESELTGDNLRVKLN